MDGCEFNGQNISVTFAQSDRKSETYLKLAFFPFTTHCDVINIEKLFNQPPNQARIQWPMGPMPKIWKLKC